MNSRTNRFLENVVISFFLQVASYFFTFCMRTVFIIYLGKEYLGIQGLFTNILSLLSLSELGIGAAITFCLYEPLARQDTEKIKRLMNYYAKAYRVVACVIFICGMALLPFLDFFLKEAPKIKETLSFIYILFLMDSSMSYLFIYKKTIISADQKEYINSTILNISIILRNLIQIIVLVLTSNYILFLLVQIMFTFLANVITSRKADILYPYLKQTQSERIDVKEKKELTKKISAMFCHNIGAFITTGTDNILISKFMGLAVVGVYSNYTLLIGIATRLMNQITSILTPGIANLSYSEEQEKVKSVFEQLFLMNYWITLNISVGMIAFLDPFISLWIGDEFILPTQAVVLLVIQFYLYNMRNSILVFRNALGLFYQDRYKPFFESIINLGCSLFLLRYFGLSGIIMGTILGFLCTTFWVEPYILFRDFFRQNVLHFFVKYLKYSVLGLILALMWKSICMHLYDGKPLTFAVLLISLLVSLNGLLFLLFWRNKNFRALSARLRNMKGINYREED